MSIHGVFIDRDGTINVEKGYVVRIEEFEFIPGALRALRRLTETGVAIHIVTNQAGIAKGLYSERDFQLLTEAMLDRMSQHGIRIANVLFCPHHPDGVVPAYRKSCGCRKPGTDLLQSVIDSTGYQGGQFALVGDKNTDIEAGRKIGAATYLVETGYGIHEKLKTRADCVVPDLEAAVNHMLSSSADACLAFGASSARARQST